jgi:two-component system response regulator
MADGLIDILLVDDNPDDVELALHALNRDQGSRQIQVARDGAEALEILFEARKNAVAESARRPLVVLLDLKLPKVDRLEVLRRIKTDPRTHSIPVVMLTSSREERDILKSYQLGVNSYVVKPVDYDEFTQAVQELDSYWLTLNQPPVQ